MSRVAEVVAHAMHQLEDAELARLVRSASDEWLVDLATVDRAEPDDDDGDGDEEDAEPAPAPKRRTKRKPPAEGEPYAAEQQQVLAAIQAAGEGGLSGPGVVTSTQLSAWTVRRHVLPALLRQKLVRKTGSTCGTRWVAR